MTAPCDKASRREPADTSAAGAPSSNGLLPCPFCGRPASLRRFATSKDEETKLPINITHIRCDNDDYCHVCVDIQHINEAMAIEAWNTRAAPTHSQAGSNGDVPERETFWLLEMVGQQKYALWTSHHGIYVHAWTEDVWQAGRFNNERHAHDVWRMLCAAERERWKPVEHMFINKVQSTTALPSTEGK